MTKLLALFAVLSLVACSNSGSSNDGPVVIPKKLDLQVDASATMSDQDFESAKNFLLTSDLSSEVDFDIDDYLFCSSHSPSVLNPDQQKLLADIKATCDLKNNEPESRGPLEAGEVRNLALEKSITQKKSAQQCPVIESSKGAGFVKLLTVDRVKGSLTGRGNIHFDGQRETVSTEARRLLGFDRFQLKVDGTLSLSVENDGPMSKYSEFTSSGTVQPVARGEIVLRLGAQVLQPANGENQMSLSLSAKDSASSVSFSTAFVAHWTGTQIPTIDQMSLGGRPLSKDEIAKMQQSNLLRNLMKSMELNSDCSNNESARVRSHSI
jgi:hypothetical protein